MADGAPNTTMRLDRFLWWVRLAKTREVAQGLAEQGTLRLNGRRIERAAVPVRCNDTITFLHGGRVRAVRVLALPHRRGPAPEARACYSELPTIDAENVSQEAPGD